MASKDCSPLQRKFHNEAIHLAFTIPFELSQAIRSLSKQEGVTAFMTLLAAFQTLMYRYGGQDSFALGCSVANPMLLGIDDQSGSSIAALALRSDFSDSPSFKTALGRVQQGVLDAYSDRLGPFEILTQSSMPDSDSSRHPIGLVILDYKAPSATSVFRNWKAHTAFK